MVKIKAVKISETWSVDDGDNKILVTLHPDHSFEIFRVRVKDEEFIRKAKNKLIDSIIF